MSKGQLVSIVIPTYNRAYTLGNAIDSVLGQRHEELEVVIVDDGSTDGTEDLVKYRYGEDPRVRYTRQENRGVTWARNAALAMVEGDFVAFLDSDDCWEPWKLELQLACLRRLPEAGMVWTNMAAIDPDGRVVDPRYLRRMYRAYGFFTDEELFTDCWRLADVVPELSHVVGEARLHYGNIYPQIFMGNLVHTSTALLTRERQMQVRDFDTDLEPAGEDHDFHLRTVREGLVCLADVAAVRYRVGRDDALSHPSQGIFMALNNLKTLDKAVAHDREGIALPQSMINAAYAHVHRWVGDLLLRSEDTVAARRHLSRSVRLMPWQPRTVGLLAIACVPVALGRAIRGVLGWARHGIGRLVNSLGRS